jgi:hypothetical protein
MMDQKPSKDIDSEVESALIDADLFVKYKSPERALRRLKTALERHPLSVQLREHLREVAIITNHQSEAARQCLALASLYIERDDFDTAYDRLLEAKTLDARINIAPGLDAIRKARRPDLQPSHASAEHRDATFAGDIGLINIFDVIQVIENSRLTGSLVINSDALAGRLMFNSGRIVDAEMGRNSGEDGFRKIIELTSGVFDFVRSEQGFPIVIMASSNTNLVLDTLRLVDEEKENEDKGDETPLESLSG